MSQTRPKSYQEHYAAVIILDALGTKGVWKTANLEEFMMTWENLTQAIKEGLKRDEMKDTKSSFYAFSDTLIIAIKGNDVENILKHAGILTGTAIEWGIIYGIYLRGCISIGTIYEYSNMILGPAIDEAALNYEKSNWLGAFTTPSAHSALTRLSNQEKSNAKNWFVKYDIPTKNGVLKTWAVYLSDTIVREMQAFGKTDTLTSTIHTKMEKSDDVEGLEKWKNTLEYMLYLKSLKSKPV